MDDNLTPEEELVIKRIECAGDWDQVIYSLSLLIPCGLIIGLGVWTATPSAVAAGGATYCFFELWMVSQQVKATSHLRSAIRKLKERAGANQGLSPTADPRAQQR
jgi:hypothetical protein